MAKNPYHKPRELIIKDADELQALITKYGNDDDVAEFYGCTRITVRNARKRFKIKAGHRRSSKPQDAQEGAA